MSSSDGSVFFLVSLYGRAQGVLKVQQIDRHLGEGRMSHFSSPNEVLNPAKQAFAAYERRRR